MSNAPVSGNAAAFERHVLPELEVLAKVARSLTRHEADAEDLVQDTLLRAYRAIDRFDGQHPRAWLLTILRNTHINRNRRRRPELLRDADGELDQLAQVASTERTEGFVDEEIDGEILRAVDALEAPFREIVQLIDVHGLTYAEAAALLEIPSGTVMSRLHRARRRIRDQLAVAGLAPRSNQ